VSLKASNVHRAGCTTDHAYILIMEVQVESSKLESEQQYVIEMEQIVDLTTSSIADGIKSSICHYSTRKCGTRCKMIHCVLSDGGDIWCLE